MNTPLLSIIIPVYNTFDYLDSCIQSIINQYFTKWELILVDDGSTDGSGVRCDYYSCLDNRIKVIHTVNRGQSAARNTGMELSKGKYLTFVDSDDEITPETYSENIEYLLSNSSIEVLQYPTFEGYPEGVLCRFPEKTYKTNRDIQIAFLEHFTYVTASPVNKIYLRQSVNQIRFPEGRLHEDYIFIDQLIQIINTFRISDKGCYHYYHRPTSTTHSQKASRFLDLLDCDISRLKRRYDFPELHHLILEQYIYVIKEWQNIKHSFPNDNLTDSFKEINKLKPKLRYCLKGFTFKNFCLYLLISIINLNNFTNIYQRLMRKS